MGEQNRTRPEKFFNEVIRHPVPLDMNTLKALKRSTLGLDLYLWLVYRTFALRAPLRLTWKSVVPASSERTRRKPAIIFAPSMPSGTRTPCAS